MPIMSTNFSWKPKYDVKLWRHKKRKPNTNDHHMPLNEPPAHENFLRTPLYLCIRESCQQHSACTAVKTRFVFYKCVLETTWNHDTYLLFLSGLIESRFPVPSIQTSGSQSGRSRPLGGDFEGQGGDRGPKQHKGGKNAPTRPLIDPVNFGCDLDPFKAKKPLVDS